MCGFASFTLNSPFHNYFQVAAFRAMVNIVTRYAFYLYSRKCVFICYTFCYNLVQNSKIREDVLDWDIMWLNYVRELCFWGRKMSFFVPYSLHATLFL